MSNCNMSDQLSSAKRKAFNFYRSYFDVFLELETKEERHDFIEALLKRQFWGLEPVNSKGIVKFAYNSQKHSIDQQVEGFEKKTGTILTPPNEGGLEGTIEGPIEGGSLQEKEEEKGKEKGKEEEEGKEYEKGKRADETSSLFSSENASNNLSTFKIDYQKIVSFYHEKCFAMPKVQTLTTARRKTIKARIAEHGFEKVMNAIEKAGQSNFLNNRTDNNFLASFDWIFKPANMVKIFEGNYNEREKKEFLPFG